MGMTQGVNLETLWKNMNTERLMSEPSDNKETELYLSPLQEIVELTGSQLCFL